VVVGPQARWATVAVELDAVGEIETGSIPMLPGRVVKIPHSGKE
jgi:hypothetical protein